MKTLLLSFAIGLAAGGFGGMIGIGGGVIMVPLLTGLFKLSQHQAHGTSLLALVFTGLSGALMYGLHGQVDWQAAAVIAVAAVITARWGARFAHSLSEKKLRQGFGLFLIVCAFLLAAKPFVHANGVSNPVWVNFALFLATGAVTGFASGMMGIGGGVIMILSMVMLAGFNQHLAQGTSLLVMIPAGCAGSLTHWRLGNVTMKILPGLVTGILAGATFGGYSAHLIPEDAMRLLFVLVIFVMGVWYIRVSSKKPSAADSLGAK